MYVIGLTGGIGAGKSTVAVLLVELGAQVIDADKEGHLAYRQGTIGWGRVVTLFGADILDEDGEVDRKQLGELVFGNPDAMALLNSAIHPLIRQSVQRKLDELRQEGAGVAVVEAALLYPAGWDDMVDEVWAVTAPAAAVIPRLEDRGLAKAEARQRIESQEPPDSQTARADVVLENAGTLDELQSMVRRLWEERLAAGRPNVNR